VLAFLNVVVRTIILFPKKKRDIYDILLLCRLRRVLFDSLSPLSKGGSPRYFFFSFFYEKN